VSASASSASFAAPIATGRPSPAHATLHLVLMLALTLTTGIVDAVGYLGLDRVFTGNMTGNVVILAMALTGADGLPIIGPLIALALFVAGAAIAGRTLRSLPAGWSTRTTLLMMIVAALLAAVGVTSFAAPHALEPVAYSITGALGLAMGMQAGAARHIAVSDVTTVVVTSTLVGLAFDSKLGRGAAGHPWIRRLGAIVLLGVGAALGSLLLRFGLGWPALLAAATVLAVAVVGHVRARAKETVR
jgi:uncharacterized membrane protein YoaK (UPF0700 family)